MKKPHKHAELIKAWADGAEIECLLATGLWSKAPNPNWDSGYEYRIKPEPKPDVVEPMSIYRNLNRRYEMERAMNDHPEYSYIGNVLLTWDGTTGKLKSAEVI